MELDTKRKIELERVDNEIESVSDRERETDLEKERLKV